MKKPDREEIESLRSQGMTRREIAEHFNVPLARVKRWIAVLHVTKKHKPKTPRTMALPTKPQAAWKFDGIMEQAAKILRDRLKERPGIGYILDGRPANSFQVLEAAGLPSGPPGPKKN